MKRIQLLPFGSVDAEILAELCEGLAREFGVPCEILDAMPEPAFAFNRTRRQYCSTEILASMAKLATPNTWRLLGVTGHDLYIPILTFVFGEAQHPGLCALVSFHRLRQEFYGLPADSTLFHRHLLTGAVHELGHTLALPHCEDYWCVMSPSHGVEWIDLKSHRFCETCRTSIPTRQSVISLKF